MLTVLLSLVSSHLSAADWPTRARTMSRSAFVPDELPLDEGHLNLKWKRFFGERIEVEMEPTVVGDTVFIGIMNGKLYALNKETGATKWVFTASGPITDTPTLFYVDTQLRIVFGALDGKVYCLDASTGSEQWGYQTGGPIMSTPSVYDGTVFIGSLDKTFYALNAINGSLAWSSTTSGPISCTSAVGDIGSGQTGVFFATGDNVAYAFRTDGTLLWNNQMAGAFTKRTYAVYGQGISGKKVVMFVTRKAGRAYSEQKANLPSELEEGPKDGPTVINAWANYYQQYPRRRSLYYFDADTGEDLWQGTDYTPLYIPYWGEYSPIVDDKGYAWFAASGGAGSGLNHDERLWKINLETGAYTHVAYAEDHKLRMDEVGRGTLVNGKYYQTASEDIGYYDTTSGQTNPNVFGNAFYNHRKPLELDELPGTIFGGMHKHFTRFGSSGSAAFGGGNDATSPLVVSGDDAFVTMWGHLYALTSEQTTPTKDYMNLDLSTPPASTLSRAQVRQMLNDAIQSIVDDDVHLEPVSRMWAQNIASLSRTLFWHSGEVIRTLAETLDYIDEPLKTHLINYLRNEIETYILNSSYYAYRFACIDYDSGQVDDPCDNDGIYVGWYWNNKNLIAERIYAIYKYAQKANDWELINNNWSFIVNTMYGAVESDWDADAGFFLWAEWLSGKFNPNLQMGAMYAMQQMAQQVGDSATEAEVTTYYNSMLTARVTWGNYVRSLYDTGDLQRDNYDDWQDWGYTLNISPMPKGGYLDKDNDFRQPYSITRSGSLVVAYENRKEIHEPYYLVGFHPFYTELNDLVRTNLSDHIDDHIKAIEMYNSWWYMGDYSHQVAVGRHEEDSFSPIAASDIFQAKAYIFNDTFEDLAPHLPWTLENYDHRDIYRLQNLVALLGTDSGPAAPNFIVIIPESTTEGVGTLADQGTVTIPDTLASDLTVSLSSSDTTEVTVPASVIIPAGSTSATFDLTIIDDAEVDGTQSVTVTASATGWTQGTDTIAVADNEQQAVTNLLVNGDFESGQIVPWQGVTDAHVSTDAAHSGTYGAHLPSAQNLFQRWITVEPGKTYVFTGWFKWTAFSGSDWGYDTIGVTNKNWESEGSINNLHALYERDKWHKLAITFTASTDGVQLNFGVFGPKETVDMVFDDFTLFEKTGNLPPVVSPSSNTDSGDAPLSVQFFANGEDPDGAIAIYQWDFGDGTIATVDNPTHTFRQKGTYTVQLSVWDDEGASASGSLNITVNSDSNPMLTITGPTDQETYSTALSQLSLSGTAVALPGRNIVGLVWDNINTDEAGIVSITPAQTVNWSDVSIDLKPGENEILLTTTDSAGAVSTDRIIVTRSFSGPVISNISIPQTTVNVYEKFEIQFDVETVAENPYFQYDEAPPPGVTPQIGITVEGIFTSPSGQVLRQPGFLYREMLRTGSGGQTHYEETNQAHWVVRFSTLETGEYSVSLSVQDASGSTEISAGNFTALPPVKQGFIQVSPDDPRYFEFMNRDLFFPIGPAWGSDYSAYKGTGISFDRPWMAGQAAYSSNWARWMRTDIGMGNEGFNNPLTFMEHYPSHEISREMYYPEGHRIWMGLWMDEGFYPDLKANTEYLIKLRLKTRDIAGPVDPSYPYGFMLKTHGFPTETLEEDLRSYPSMIPVISQNRGWHTVLVKYTTTVQDGDNQYLSLCLDNVSDGKVYIDQFSMKEIFADGTYGGELIRHSRADMHTYVEQRPAAYFDWQVEQGEQNGVFFKYVIQDKRDWVPNHLTREGVFQDVGDGYFQEDGTKAKWLLQQWWRYLIARWGYSTAVHSWELCNEASPDAPAVYRQTQDLAKFMHQNDSHPHLVTTSFWCCWRPDFWGDRANYPDVDYADLHEYTKDSELGLDMAEWVLSWGQTTYESPVGMPVILGETGIGEPEQSYFEHLRQPNSGIWYHNILWAQLNAGSGISVPNYWWSQHFNLINRQQIATPFHQFVSSLDINQGGYVDLSATVTNSNIRVLGQKNISRGKAYLWIQNKLHNWHNVMGVENPDTITPESGTVTVQMSPNTEYSIEKWNTYTGEVQSNTLQSDDAGDITISVVDLYDDFAVKVEIPGSSPACPRGFRILE